MDLIHSLKQVNYFGKCTEKNEIKVEPILLKKGVQRLALYGLSHVPDRRLAYLFRNDKVNMPEPTDEACFNILVLHQNRPANRGKDNIIEDEYLPSFLDFVYWGHEHDCQIDKINSVISGKNFKICQPGSSVATSLSSGEAETKYIAVLHVHDGKQFTCEPIKLETVRPFIFKTIQLFDKMFDVTKVNIEVSMQTIVCIFKEMELKLILFNYIHFIVRSCDQRKC